ncbi:metallophosphoesterase [Cyanobium sp. HWJ4-Hawea]|uniref:metallophosphoesterase n=1 Tax=unclassified Cyanobium TaxID=2627006 RepID=UPI0020CD6077|nr:MULTISPECIES: metallophosphoesterase [unclassified Cyanobium]MCP9774269.1 metallophosphoesterase [Cyanobium sp. WAJ14-Wanaka]MCP9808222.1 metallophosphoesterase [Cyanobium sp. HWJ4-Hawea]
MTSPNRSCRHWVIGDVHGCAEPLAELVRLLPSQDRLVLCGDVINRGPEIQRTMELAWSLVESGRAIWLKGNHEADLVRALGSNAPWQAHQALAGSDTYRQLGDTYSRLWGERLANLPVTYGQEGWVATHAGFDPQTWLPDLNVRMPFWQAYDGRFGEVIIGHTPGPHVRRLGDEGPTQIVMVDTGACYGGELTAYCPETRAIRQVSARPATSLRCLV